MFCKNNSAISTFSGLAGIFLIFLTLIIPSNSWAQKKNEDPNQSQRDFIDSLKNSGEDSESDQVRALKAELLIAKNEKKAMAQIQKLLRKYRGSHMEAGLWFRLAELYMRRSKADRFFEVNRESETIVKLAPKLVKKASAKNSITEAISIYDRLERKFPDFRDMDLVLYNSAFARQQVNRNGEAKKLYTKLIRSFENSPLIPDAYLALGEMLFDEQNYKEARKQFEAIKAFPESRIYPYGRYKLAWTLYNLREVETGLKELEAVVAYSREGNKEGAENRLDLIKEALTDMVLFYSEQRPSDQAVSYFVEQAGKAEAGNYILRLIRLYNRHGKTQDEAKLFYKFVDVLDTDPVLPSAYVSMINSYEDQRKRNKAAFEMERFSDLCEPGKNWAKANTQGLAGCIDLVSKVSSNYAAKWHRLWKKNVTHLEIAGFAERAYLNFLKWDATSDKSTNIRYEFANLLFETKKFRRSSDEYFLVAKAAKKQPMIHDASYGAIFSLQKAVGDKWEKSDEERYVEIAGVYIERNPTGKYREDIEFKRAFIIYDNKRYDEAAPLLYDLGERYQAKKQGIKAQDLYLDILSKKNSFLETKNYSAHLMAREKDASRKEKLKKIYQESYFASIDSKELTKEGDKEKPVSGLAKATSFLNFAKENMDSPLAEKAWWNAVVLYKSEASPKEIADTSFEFSRKFPKSSLKADSLKIATQNYEWITDLEHAAETSRMLIFLDPKNEFSWKKLSVDYLQLSGKDQSAEEILKKSLNAPKKEEQLWALESLYLMAQEKKDKEKEKYYEEFVLKTSLQPYTASIYKASIEKNMEKKKYPEAFKQASLLLGMKDAPQSARAFARLSQARILKKEFFSQSMVARPERVATVIALKTEKLDKAQRAFQASAKIGDAEVSVEAYIELAECYGHYAKALREMKLKDIPEADAQVFYQEMASLAIPMEEREVETLVKALEIAKQLKLRNGSVRRIRQRMDELNMRAQIYFDMNPQKPKIMVPQVSEVKL